MEIFTALYSSTLKLINILTHLFLLFCSYSGIMNPILIKANAPSFFLILSTLPSLGHNLWIIHSLHLLLTFLSIMASLPWYLITFNIFILTKELLPRSDMADNLCSFLPWKFQKNSVSCFTFITLQPSVMWLQLYMFMESIFAKIIYDYLVLKPTGHLQVFILLNFSDTFAFKNTPSHLK